MKNKGKPTNHMIYVAVLYFDGQAFIIHDEGSKFGKGFLIDFQVIFQNFATL